MPSSGKTTKAKEGKMTKQEKEQLINLLELIIDAIPMQEDESGYFEKSSETKLANKELRYFRELILGGKNE